MALDTAAKRFSLMGFGVPIPQMVIVPDATVAASDRADLVMLYSGLALSALVAAAGLTRTPWHRGFGTMGVR